MLIDTPPVLPVTDAAVLAAYADATLMVIAAGTTTKKQARRAVEILERVDATPLGVIVNRIPHRGGNFYYGYGYGYRYGRRTPERYGAETPPAAAADTPAPGENAEDWDTLRMRNGGNGAPPSPTPESPAGPSTAGGEGSGNSSLPA